MCEKFDPPSEQWSRKSREHTEWEEYVEAGTKIHRWIEDPRVRGCFVPRIYLKLTDISQRGWSIRQFAVSFPSSFLHDAITLGIPVTGSVSGNSDCSGIGIKLEFQMTSHNYPSHRLEGTIARSVIFITLIERVLGAPPPWISELIKVAYENEFPLDTLRHIFLNIVINEDTKHLIKTLLYTSERGLSWPDDERRIWEYPTPEYHAILGTRIGKVVGYFVLGAFTRGTRRVSRIVSWAGVLETITLRFDLEEC